MTWMQVMITEPAKLSVRNNQLVIKKEKEVTIPLQDICSLTLENKSITLTQSVLGACSENRIILIACDQKKIPTGLFTSYHQHSRQLSVLEMQLALSKPLKKRLWQLIVKQKIENQAFSLNNLNKDGDLLLRSIIKQVESGDKTNREAYAAKVYFPKLFGKDFTRRASDERNKLLNYGYAIIRGAVARSLVAYGFTPCLGIYHDSKTNQFNLADDFMEVFRPLVDIHVATQVDFEWNVQTRANLVNLLNMETEISNSKYSVSVAVDEMIKSFVAVCRQQDYSYLKLPKLLPLSLHDAI